MDTATLKSYSWLRKIPGELFSLDEKPLLGFPPAFPVDAFSKELSTALQIENFSISLGEVQWRSSEELFSGLGDQSLKLKGVLLALNPIPGSLFFVLPENGLKYLANVLSQSENQAFEDFIDPDFLTAYFEFLSMEACRAFESVNSDKKLSPSIVRINEFPAEDCLAMDVIIKCKDKSIYGRLLLSQTFRKAWMQKHLLQSNMFNLDGPAADSLEVIVHLEAGKIDLKPSEWQKLSIGDFVLIDRCSLDPDGDKGRVMLVINGTPCFRAKIKQGSLKILEHPLYYEVDKSMPAPSDKNAEENHDDLFEDEFTEDSAEYSDEHSEELFNEHSEEHSDELSDDDFDIEEENKDKKKEVKPAGAAKPPEQSAAQKASPDKASLEKKPANQPLNIEEIPLNVVIEVGRIQMSVKKLMELQPGNMLELDIHPESSVDMVVNGKRIARGELLKIGDALGLRIITLS